MNKRIYKCRSWRLIVWVTGLLKMEVNPTGRWLNICQHCIMAEIKIGSLLDINKSTLMISKGIIIPLYLEFIWYTLPNLGTSPNKKLDITKKVEQVLKRLVRCLEAGELWGVRLIKLAGGISLGGPNQVLWTCCPERVSTLEGFQD